MTELASTFDALALQELPRGTVKAVSDVIGIPLGTIKDWKSRLHDDPEWRAYQNRNQHRRALTEEQEAELCRQIREEYIRPGLSCPPRVCQILGARIHGQQVLHGDACGDVSSDSDDSDDICARRRKRPRISAFTRRWRAGFLKRNGLSLRRPHIRRRARVSDELTDQFLIDVRESFDRDDREAIYNMDETHWCLINPHQVTDAPRGAENISVNFTGDPKLGLTAIAIMTAAGEKLPLWIICKGTTERCERRFRNHFARQIESE
jgi:hypothetical protein